MSGMSFLQIAAGIVLLVGGAELFVRGAAAIANRLRVPRVLVGLTVVALGTSLPETAIAMNAALGGSGAVALGNAIGSNIFNVLIVLGIAALIRPLVVHRHLVRVDVPVMVGTAILALLLTLDGHLSRGDGLMLLGLGVVYTMLLGFMAKRSDTPVDELPPGADEKRLPTQTLFMIGGLVLLVLGSRALVDGATAVATSLGVSELVVGLTVVAFGTSLPELATSVIAAFRGFNDLAVGSIVGSNIFNVLIVLGCAGAVAPGGVAVGLGVLTFDFPVMIAASVACLPIFFTGWCVDRWEGAVFVAYYAVYATYLVLYHSGHAAQDLVGAGVTYFAAPLTILTLGVVLTRQWKVQRQRAGATPPSRPEG